MVAFDIFYTDAVSMASGEKLHATLKTKNAHRDWGYAGQVWQVHRVLHKFGPWLALLVMLGLNACGQKTAHIPVNASGVASVDTFTISGTVVNSAKAPIEKVHLILGGDKDAVAESDANGHYTFAGLPDGDYTVSPLRAGYRFAVTSQAVSIRQASVANIDFVASPNPAPLARYSLSGRIVDVSDTPVSGITVELSGNAVNTAVTDAGGNYAFAALLNGAYTVTPKKTGTAFTPLSRAVIISGADAPGVDFSSAQATVTTYSVSGHIATSGGDGMNGVTVTFSGAGGSVTTNASGDFTLAGLANGDYTVTPSLTGGTFEPGSRNATVSNGDVANINFTGTPPSPPPAPTFTLAGRIVTSAGAGLGGVAVALSGDAVGNVTSDGNGDYAFTALNAGLYTVTPELPNNTFSPVHQDVALTADLTGINFTRQPPPPVATYSISGHVADNNGSALSGVALAIGSVATSTDGNGAFKFTGLSDGEYAIVPSAADFSFSPAVLNVIINGANFSTADFTAIPLASGGRNFTLYVTAGILTVSGTGGAAIPAWSFTHTAGTAKFPGPVLTVNEGDTVTVTVHNQHSWDHNFVIQGITTDTAAIAPGNNKAYTFSAAKAGTYLYYDTLNNNINRAMGLYGALVVNAAGGAATAWTGGPAYTFQRLWVTGDMDKPNWNDVASKDTVPNVSTVNTAVYKPNYFLINGMGGKAAMDDIFNTAISGRVGETALVRILNAGQYPQTFHFHANHVQVLSVDGERRSAPYKLLDVLHIPPLGGAEVLFYLNQPGIYPMHNHTAQMETANGVYLNGVATMIYIR